MDIKLRNDLIKLAHKEPEIRKYVVPILQRYAARHTTKRDMKLRNGDKIPRGTPVEIEFLPPRDPQNDKFCFLKMRWMGLTTGRDYWREPMKTRLERLSDKVTGIRKPSMRTLERMMDDGVSITPTGQKVEPDGHGRDNSPSWLLVFGLI